MKKSEVNVCDICRRVVTEKKCEICDKDICKDCEDDMGVGLANGGVLFFIISCKQCSNKLEKGKMKKYFDEKPHRDIRKGIVKLFRTAIVVENLQDDDEKYADKSWLLDKIKKEHPFKKTSFPSNDWALTPKRMKRTGKTTTGRFTTMSKINSMKGGSTTL